MSVYIAADGSFGDADGLIITNRELPEDFNDWTDTERAMWRLTGKEPDPPSPNRYPHAQTCGRHYHEHGSGCDPDCPTCLGR